MALQPRAQLGDEVASYVRDLITSGKLVAGDPVRPEAIAEELEISATPAREGLQSLRAEGLLELVPRRGFRVAAVSADDIRDMFLINSMVAGELAARAAGKASPAALASMRAIHEEFMVAAENKDAAELERLNHRFHREINLAAGSLKLAWIIQLVSKWIPQRFYTSIEGWADSIVRDHRSLLAAIEAHDAHRARTLMSAHILNSGEQLAMHVEERAKAADVAAKEAQVSRGSARSAGRPRASSG